MLIPIIGHAIDTALQSGDTATIFETVNPLINALGKIGPAAVPLLLRIAESQASDSYQGQVLWRILSMEEFFNLRYRPDPWNKVHVMMQDGGLLAQAMQKELPRIHTILLQAIRKKDESYLQRDAAYLLARWGSGELHQLGIRTLVELAKNTESWSTHQVPILLLFRLKAGPLVDLIRKNLPTEEQEPQLFANIKIDAAQALFQIGDRSYLNLLLEGLAKGRPYDKMDAFDFMKLTHDLACVPGLIDLLKDRSPIGPGWTIDETRNGKSSRRPRTVADEAWSVLKLLTFQSFENKPELWQKWWQKNSGATWKQLLATHVQKRLATIDTVDRCVLQGWMTEFRGAFDPAALPFFRAYIQRLEVKPSTALESICSEALGGRQDWPYYEPPVVISFLLGLRLQENGEAETLLERCLNSTDREIRQSAAFTIGLFDRSRGAGYLVKEMDKSEGIFQDLAADKLLLLGDKRGIPSLIRRLNSTEESSLWWSYSNLRYYTQEPLPFDPKGSKQERQIMVSHWEKWWQQKEAEFQIDLRAAEIDRDAMF